jgi:hypothetical protein
MEIKRAIAAAAVGVGVVASSLIVVSPASAALSECPSGAACSWIDANWVGYLTPFYSGISSYSAYGMNDKPSAVYNNGNTSQVRMYQDEGYGNAYFSLPIKVGDADLGNFDGYVAFGWNNRISSGKFV